MMRDRRVGAGRDDGLKRRAVGAVREQMREHIRAELDAWNEEAKVPLSSITGLSRSAGK